MNRKIISMLLALLVLASVTQAGLGIKKADEYVSFSLNEPLDSDGDITRADSAHVHTYLMSSTAAAAYNAASTSYPFTSVGIDTTIYNVDTAYWFSDQIQDIDGTPGGSDYGLTILVELFADDQPMRTQYSVQVLHFRY